MHDRKVLYSSCAGKHGARYNTNFITLKAVLTFQTLMLATLGKWATTHDRVFILGNNCSWNLLPGSTWLQTPITHLYQSSVRSYRTHFASLKRVDDLRVYWGFMMPLNHQAGYKGTLQRLPVTHAPQRLFPIWKTKFWRTSVKHFHDNSRVHFMSVSQPCSIVVRSGIIDQLWQSNLQFENFAEMEGYMYYVEKTWSVFESHRRNTFCERNVCEEGSISIERKQN